MRISLNDLAWLKGEGSYAEGDTAEDGARKAEAQGYRPGSQGYGAFLDGFLNRIRGASGPSEFLSGD